MNPMDYQAQIKLAEKQAAKAKEQKEARTISQAIDPDGKIRVWHVGEQKYKKLWPIDARQLIQSGYGFLEQPEPEPEPEPETHVEGELESMKVQELKDICADLNIEEYDGVPVAQLKKPQLIAAIRAHTD